MRKGSVEREPYKARAKHTSPVKLKVRLHFITLQTQATNRIGYWKFGTAEVVLEKSMEDWHLGNPVAKGVNDAANHHLGKNWVGLGGLLVNRPVVLRHVAQDLKDGPPLHQIQSRKQRLISNQPAIKKRKTILLRVNKKTYMPVVMVDGESLVSA